MVVVTKFVTTRYKNIESFLHGISIAVSEVVMKTLITKLLVTSLMTLNSHRVLAQSESISLKEIILGETSSRLETFLRRNGQMASLFPVEFLAAGHQINQRSFPSLQSEEDLKTSHDYVEAALEQWASISTKAIDPLALNVLENNLSTEIFVSNTSPICTFSFPQLPTSMPAIVGEELRKQLFSQLISQGWKYDSANGDILIWFDLSTKWDISFEYQLHIHYLNFVNRVEKSELIQRYDESLIISSSETFKIKSLTKKMLKKIPTCQNILANTTPTEVL